MVGTTSLVPFPSRAMAPHRKRRYAARTGPSRAIAERVPELIAALSVTPTIRQVFYILVGEALLLKTEAAYKSLVRQLGRMRKGGELPYSAVIDGTRDRKLREAFERPSAALAYLHAIYRRNPWDTQPRVAEVWAEADTLSQMLWQVADPLVVPVVVCRGNSSLSQLYTSAAVIHKRWEEKRQGTVILYAGDFDPAGMDMSDHLHDRLVEVGAPGEAVVVERVAITPEQIAAHRLPPHEPKHKDARTPEFIARYGVGCVEADALPPGVLATAIEGAIRACSDDIVAWVTAEEQQEHDLRALRVLLARQAAFVDDLASDYAGAGTPQLTMGEHRAAMVEAIVDTINRELRLHPLTWTDQVRVLAAMQRVAQQNAEQEGEA